MILKEFEGKKLLSDLGLVIPKSVLISKNDQINQLDSIKNLEYPVFVKAQVLHGNRELQGLVSKSKDFEELKTQVNIIFSKKDQYGQKIEEVLVEEMADFSEAMYVSISYDTQTRTPVLQFSKNGGTGMDDRGDSVIKIPISIRDGITEFLQYPELTPFLQKLFKLFIDNDASLVEINPLVKTKAGFMFLDAKIELENVAKFRHPEWSVYGNRTQIGKPPTAIETRAHNVSKLDTRGVAGESFFEFEGGNIGVMASGGGASVLAMDALLAEGLKPANYTEYSGNPTREKVHELTKVVLSLPNLEALYVVGSNANFTDIYETLYGIVDGLLEADLPEGFKVLIRRGGPRWEEAFQMVKERLANKNIQLKLFGPKFSIVKTARELKKMFENDKIT